MSLAWISVGALVLAVTLSCTTTINVGILSMAMALIVGVFVLCIGIGSLLVGATRHRSPNALVWNQLALTLALLAAFAWCGTLLALASLARVHALVRARRGPLAGWAFVCFACLSSGFGIWPRNWRA